MIPNRALFVMLMAISLYACKSDNQKTTSPESNTEEEGLVKMPLKVDTTTELLIVDTLKVDSALVINNDIAKVDTLIKSEVVVKQPVKAKKKIKPAPIKPKPQPIITFKELVYDFGTINEGDIIDYKYIFKNTGSAPLEIKSVKVSCGCTFPSYPFLDIKPGDTGHIGVTFKSAGKSGFQNPKLTVKTNITNQEFYLHLKGNVIKKQDTEEVKLETPKPKQNQDSIPKG